MIHFSNYPENLVDVIPKRGHLFLKSIKRIDDAVWVHQKLGSAMIHSIYIRRVPKSELELLSHPADGQPYAS